MRLVLLWCGIGLLAACDCGGGSGPGRVDGGGDGAIAVDAADAMATDGSVDAPERLDADTDAGPDECGEETCGDFLDDDCDGRVEEGCACVPGDTARCFRGRAPQRGVGACRDGDMVCTGGEEFGEWGPCEGDVPPAEETCDVEGVDEDCDGAANEGCDCADGDPPVSCGLSEGTCEPGTSECVDGIRTECMGATLPGVETCNALDDDCDGTTDEHLTRGCGSDVGVCRMGTETCVAGAFGSCEGGNTSSAEACDGLDNDCDGSTDESVTRLCGMDEGRCVAGTETCGGGVFGTCEGRVDAIAETCNNVDDDCDASTDEGVSRPCGTDVGRCRAGSEICTAGAFGSCTGAIFPATEQCEGSVDEDCDGTVDEGCACLDGSMRSCGSDVGRCDPGSQTCTGGMWRACVGAVEPRTERCDGTDDDCDGLTDEGCDCITGRTRACGSSTGVCRMGLETCDSVGRWGACEGDVEPSGELCNSMDDDCDGPVDEGDVCPRFPPTVMCPGSRTVTVGDATSLVGGGSDPDGGPVTFAWTVVTRPAGSSANPSPSGSATTSFTPDAAGNYTLRLCVTDDELETACCTVMVTAEASCTPPAVPTVDSCGISWDRRPVVEFTPVPAGIDYELRLDGTPYATVASAGTNWHRPASAIAPGGPPPGTTRSIVVRACVTGDPTCCSTSAAVDVQFIEDCTTPVAPSSDNLVFSEYVINGDGACPGPDCEGGEAIEITNLSHCPVELDGTHFSYCNPGSCGAFRWMNFGPDDIIPPRGVYVAIRNQAASMCSYPFFGPNDPSLFGLRISDLDMEGSGLSSGWFNNGGGGMSRLRVAGGAFVDMTTGATFELVAPYSGSAGECSSVGFDAVGRCGTISPVATPSDVLTPNQLGRLWHPCDAIAAPVPATCN